MPFKIKRSIFARGFRNEPSEKLSYDIDIITENSSGKFNLKKDTPAFQTEYILTVYEPSVIGLSHDRRGEKAIKDLVLALNLNLQQTCFSIHKGGMPTTEITSPSSIEKIETPKGPRVTIPVSITTRYHLTLSFKETLNEEEVINTLKKIIRVNRFDLKSDLRKVNLSKALNEYENAMHPSDRLIVFRSLYNSIEFCINWTGTNYTGSDLDSQIASIIDIDKSTAKSWRELYNRTKHVDRKAVHTSRLIKGIELLPSSLPQIREVTKQLIINRLDQIY